MMSIQDFQKSNLLAKEAAHKRYPKDNDKFDWKNVRDSLAVHHHVFGKTHQELPGCLVKTLSLEISYSLIKSVSRPKKKNWWWADVWWIG